MDTFSSGLGLDLTGLLSSELGTHMPVKARLAQAIFNTKVFEPIQVVSSPLALS